MNEMTECPEYFLQLWYMQLSDITIVTDETSHNQAHGKSCNILYASESE